MINLKLNKSKINKELLPILLSILLLSLLGLLVFWVNYVSSYDRGLTLIPWVRIGFDYVIDSDSLVFPENLIEYQWGLGAIELAYLVFLFLQIRDLIAAILKVKVVASQRSKRKLRREIRDFSYLLSLPILANLIPFVLIYCWLNS